MNITFYSCPHLSHGRGFERAVIEFSNRLARRGHVVTIITTNYAKSGMFDYARHIDRAVKYVPIRSISTVPDAFALYKELDGQDIVYFNNSFIPNDLVMWLFGFMRNKKVVMGYHGQFPELGNAMRKAYHKLVNRYIAKNIALGFRVQNRERKLLLKKEGYGNVFIVYDGVDTKRFGYGKDAKYAGKKFRVLFVGALTMQKGADLLVEIIEQVNMCKSGEVEFYLVGSGPLALQLEKVSASAGNVTLLKSAETTELKKLYEESNVLVAPSRYEEFLITPLEAMASGTPIIVSDIPGPREYADPKSSILVSQGDITGFSKAILATFNKWKHDRQKYLVACKSARESAKKYSWDAATENLEAEFISLLKTA